MNKDEALVEKRPPRGPGRMRDPVGRSALAQQPPATGAVAQAPAAATPSETAPATVAPPAVQSQPGTAAPAETVPSTMALALPHDLSPWGMFMAADIIVKAVMIGLAFASLVTWTIWLAKSLEIFGGKLRIRRAVRAIGDAATLTQASRALDRSGGPACCCLRAAEEETALSAGALDHVSETG